MARARVQFARADLASTALMVPCSAVVVFVVPSDYWYCLMLIPRLCLALAAVGQQIVMGYAGQLALGALGCMAALAFALFNLELRMPYLGFPVNLDLSGLITAAFGLPFGLPSLWVRGIYLTVATPAAQFSMTWMIDRFGRLKSYDTSSLITARDIVIFERAFTTQQEMYLVMLVVITIKTMLAINMTSGSTGRDWVAVRNMDIADGSMGISLLRTKLQAFAIFAFFCSVANALFAFTYLKSMDPAAFDNELSFEILFMVILGGLGTIISFIGLMVFGTLITLIMICEPLGMAKLWSNIKQRSSAKRAGLSAVKGGSKPVEAS